jgi:hypothetical protein
MGQLKRQLVIWGAIATTTAVLPGLALADNVSPERGGGRHGRGDHGRDHRDGDAKLAVAGRAMSKGTTDSYGLQIRGRSGDQPTDAGGMIRFAHKGDKAMEGLVGEITCLSKDSAGVVSVTGTITRSGKREGKGDEKKPGLQTAAASDDDGTALLDELAPWDAEVAAEDPTVPGAPAAPSLPGQDPNKDKDPNKGKDPNKKGPERGKRGGGELAGKDFAFTIDVPGKPQKFSKPTIGDKGTLAACSGGGDSVEVTRGQFRTREADAAKSKDNDKDKGERGDHRHGRRGWRR